MTCKCATVHAGNTPVGKNWNPDCPEHPWDERLQAQNDRAVEMQLKAAEARKAARPPSLVNAAHTLVAAWNQGENLGGEHDLDELNRLVRQLDDALFVEQTGEQR